MVRARDEAIPAEEPLYRSISSDYINGEDILPQAIDLPRCSFNRSKHSIPEAVRTLRRPNDTGIVELLPRNLPPPVPRASGSPYEFFAVDDPNPAEDPENDAHCEVRIKPQGAAFSKNHKVKKDVLALAKNSLAKNLRLHTPPR